MDARKLLLRRQSTRAKIMLSSDGFSAYPNTDGLGGRKWPWRGGTGKAWGPLGYGTWGAAGGVMQASVLSGGTAVNCINSGAANISAAVKVINYTAGWAGVAVRYVNQANFLFGYWDGTRMRLTKDINNVTTGLVISGLGLPFANGSIIRIDADLVTASLFLDDVLVGSAQTLTDLQLIGSPYHGVVTSALSNTFDNANIYPLGANVVHNTYCYGDSKTGQTGDTTINLGGYPIRLCTATLQLVECPARVTVGGTTVALRAAAIATDLAAAVGNPQYILCNLGANDVSALPAEATWEANYQTIINAMHTRWAAAKIYLMRPWRRSYAAECNSLAAWIAVLVSNNPGLVYAGPDERAFLENGDDGVTYTGDGIHPNTAGYVLTASQWRTALGY